MSFLDCILRIYFIFFLQNQVESSAKKRYTLGDIIIIRIPGIKRNVCNKRLEKNMEFRERKTKNERENKTERKAGYTGRKIDRKEMAAGGRMDKKETSAGRKETGAAGGRMRRKENFSAGSRENKKEMVSPDKKTSRQNVPSAGKKSLCPHFKNCGGCQYLDMPYEKQLEHKKKEVAELLRPFCKVETIVGMEDPFHYRNKVHAVMGRDRKGKIISGVYKEGTHTVLPVETCLIENKKADEIIGTIRELLPSFKMKVFDEDTGYGFLRHVLVRTAHATGEIMVVLITASPVFPSKNNFVKALRKVHPEITTVVQNVNDRNTSMVLGEKEHVLYGPGFIVDVLCGKKFRISSKSFYQINPVQTEKLYNLAIEAAGLTGNETVVDAYCGIGTIGIVAASAAKEVIGVELNKDAVRDAVTNAKLNGEKNIRFYNNDAGKFMVQMASQNAHADVVFMDPPRSGSTEEFMDAVAILNPRRVVYVSCNPETLARDLAYFKKKKYKAEKAWAVDQFPMTGHCECVVFLERKDK